MDPKNLVRGAFAYLRTKSTPKAADDPWKRDLYAQQQINKAIEIARKKYGPRKFALFEEWVNSSIEKLAIGVPHIGAQITSLGVFPDSITAQDLQTEIRSAVERLKRHEGQLRQFAVDAANLANLLMEREWEDARTALETIKVRDGYSYWAVETELALTQHLGGVEELKSRVGKMAVGAPAWNRFFYYMFGLRNEPAQASGRFKAIARKKLSDSSMAVSLKPYARFRLYGALEADNTVLAHVLACEQMTTPVDLLFTLVKVTRFILDNSASFFPSVTTAAEFANEALFETYVSLGLTKSTQQTATQIKGDLTSVRPLELVEIANAAISRSLGDDISRPLTPFDTVIVEGIASLLSTRSDGVKAEELTKLVLNLGWLPKFVELNDVALVPALPKLLSEPLYQGSGRVLSITRALHLAIAQRSDVGAAGGPLFEFLAELRLGRAESLNSILAGNPIGRDLVLSGASRDALSVALAQFQLENNDIAEFLNTCSRAGVENDRLIQLLPFGQLFQGIKWGRLKSFSSSIDLSICLNLYLRVVDDRKIRTYKRYGVEELVNTFKVANVAELLSALMAAGANDRKIEYFGYHVCDIATLELLPGIGGSRRVLEMRSGVLRKIGNLHGSMALSYLREAEDLESGLQVDDGISVLEDSKVYVDEQAVLNYVNQELEADFQRYRKLVESGVGVSESIDDLLKSFNSPSAKTFQIPKNDADDLLADLVGSILHRFVFDPASGLDIIVGRRIRHGTIAGELRGVLEGFELIGQRPRSGADYEPTAYIQRNSSNFDPKRRRIVNAAFSRFSKSIDQLVALLRDEYFHMRTKSKARGIFDVQVNPIMLALARSLAQTCTSIQEFSKECLQIFWYVLSARLDALRPAVENETKKTLHAIFGKLDGELRALAIDEDVWTRVHKAAEDLQHRASTIASWLRVPKASVENKVYAMERVVNVAAAVVSAHRPGFRPVLRKFVPEGYALDSHGFSIVADALYIAIDNVSEHSGKKVDNHITVEIRPRVEEGLLSFSISNEAAPGSRTAEKEVRLAKIRSEIQRKTFAELARRDRHSGLSKLAALVMQSDKTTSSMTFDYEEDGVFRLRFDLVHINICAAPHSIISEYRDDMESNERLMEVLGNE
jgi:hypothetical protein